MTDVELFKSRAGFEYQDRLQQKERQKVEADLDYLNTLEILIEASLGEVDYLVPENLEAGGAVTVGDLPVVLKSNRLQIIYVCSKCYQEHYFPISNMADVGEFYARTAEIKNLCSLEKDKPLEDLTATFRDILAALRPEGSPDRTAPSDL